MMEVELCDEQINAPDILRVLLDEFSAITDYRTLRDRLPKRLMHLLRCRCILLYQCIDETLQFVAGALGDQPGWSASLLAVAHINPIGLRSDIPEARVWQERQSICIPATRPERILLPLVYRQHCIGVLVAMRGQGEKMQEQETYWRQDEVLVVEAVVNVVALLLENTRLLERDKARIQELSLLNSISCQLNSSMYDLGRLRSVVIQRTREIARADVCELLEPGPGEGVDVWWISQDLQKSLQQHFQEHPSATSLIIEQVGGVSQSDTNHYFDQLPANIKTFFAFPLFSGHIAGRESDFLSAHGSTMSRDVLYEQEKQLLGIVVGAYYRPWKLSHESEVSLRLLVNQASLLLENMYLVTKIVEARNETRKLLRTVLDDQRLKALILESMPGGLVITNSSGYVTLYNRAAEEILGYAAYEVLEQPFHKFLDLQCATAEVSQPQDATHGTMPLLPADLIQLVMSTGETQAKTLSTVDRYGRKIMLELTVLPLRNDIGEQVGTLINFTDVTAVHHLEEEKRRLDRLASLGEMAANVAHEVRNPLASIKTSMQMLMNELTDNGQQNADDAASTNVWVQESIAVVLKEVERLDTIVRDLLLFARPRQLHRSHCNLIELSDCVLKLLHSQCIERDIDVHRVYSDVPFIWGDIAQLEQILLNLYVNAIQAMAEGGILTVACHCVKTSHIRRESKSLASASTAHEYRQDANQVQGEKRKVLPEQWVEIVVSDTGVGIAANQLDCIFQPFFTTKAHGIGLGLAITRRLIEDHGGCIQIESNLGYGTTVSVRLPVASNGVNEAK